MTDLSTGADRGRGPLARTRVLVTGGGGFLGRSICTALDRRGASVVTIRSRDVDLVEQQQARDMMADVAPQIVVHAAARVGGIGANIRNPGAFLYENAMMGLNVLEAARQAGVARFVLVSTTCAYPDDAPMPLNEKDIWGGKPTPQTGPYGVAKRMLHEACATYSQQYGIETAVLIPTNLYGPGDNFNPASSHVMPAMIHRYAEAARRDDPSVTNWGTGEATREFLYVTDAGEAIARACEVDITPDPINIGTGVETSIRDLAALVKAAVGYTGHVVWDATKPSGVNRRVLDITRSHEILGFRPTVDLATGVRRTVEWYLAQDPDVLARQARADQATRT